jgi:DNA-binding transcriptional regulator YiaG
MKKTKKKMKEPATRSPRLAALHKTASGLARIGVLDEKTMREFDMFCLTKVEPMSGTDIQAIRRREGVSQAVLAHHLNVRYLRSSATGSAASSARAARRSSCLALSRARGSMPSPKGRARSRAKMTSSKRQVDDRTLNSICLSMQRPGAGVKYHTMHEGKGGAENEGFSAGAS